MIRTLAAVGALAMTLALAGAANAQTYLSDWGLADMRAAVVAAGATVTEDGTEADGTPYVAAKSASGLKFTITGRVCTGPATAKRCKGALLETRFTLGSDSEVQTKVRELDYAAVAISNGEDSDLLITRYLIFDNGIHRDNLVINISVFVGVSDDVWGKL